MNGLPKKPNQPLGSKPQRPETLAKSHLAHSSIRGQTARQKQKVKEQQRAEAGSSDDLEKGQDSSVTTARGGGKKVVAGAGSKPFVKAVLANPLAPQWPEIPLEGARDIIQTLTTSFPGVAEFHLARGRLSSKEKHRVNTALKREKRQKEGVSSSSKSKRHTKDAMRGKKRKLTPEPEQTELERAPKRPRVEAKGREEQEIIEILESDEEEAVEVMHETLPNGSGTEARTKEEAEDEEEEEEEQVEVRPSAIVSPGEHLPERALPVRPPLMGSLLCGINEVFKKMERQTASLAQEVENVLNDGKTGVHAGEGVYSLSELMSNGAEDSSAVAPEAGSSKVADMPVTTAFTSAMAAPAPARIVFVCKGDMDPVDLIEPLLLYATSWNALVRNCRTRLQTRMREVKKEGKKDEGTEAFWQAAVKALVKTEEVYLVPLPKGAEMDLAAAIGLRRVAVVALTTTFPCVKTFIDKLNVLKVRPPLPSFPIQPYDPTDPSSIPIGPNFASARMKAVQTTVPKDAKAKKTQRLEEVKAKRREQKQAQKDRKVLMKKQGTLINGKLRGGTDAKERELAALKKQATDKNSLRQKKLKQKQRDRQQIGATEQPSDTASVLIPVQPPPSAATSTL